MSAHARLLIYKHEKQTIQKLHVPPLFLMINP